MRYLNTNSSSDNLAKIFGNKKKIFEENSKNLAQAIPNEFEEIDFKFEKKTTMISEVDLLSMDSFGNEFNSDPLFN